MVGHLEYGFTNLDMTLDEFETLARNYLGVEVNSNFSFGLGTCKRCGNKAYEASYLDRAKARREYNNGEWSSGYIYAEIENIRYINRVCPYCDYPEDENYYCPKCGYKASYIFDEDEEYVEAIENNDGKCSSCGTKMV